MAAMRLTDLVREKKEKKRSDSVSHYNVAPETHVYDLEQAPAPKKKDRIAGHLQVDDLASLYNITDTVSEERQPRQRTIQPPEIKTFSDARPARESVQSADEFASLGYNEPPVMPSAPAPLPTQADQLSSLMRSDKPQEPERELFENPDEIEESDSLHIEMLTYLDDIYEEGKSGSEIQLERAIQPLSQIIQFSKRSNMILRKAIRLKKGQRSFTTHSLNVSILATKIGLIRGYADERIFSLALCALLGDIGMTRVDSAILGKAGKLTADEFMEIKRHVEYSVEIVDTVKYKFPFLAPIIYQIHERENGSGYPQGLKGANIHEFAKIIGMCDVYIALTEPKANREHYSGYVAMQQIISRRGIDFDAKIIKSLIDVISVFPLESLVRLNNGVIGRVIDISAVHPTRPKLSVLINSDGEKLQRPLYLDLEKEPLLYIENPDIEEGVVL